MKKFILRYNSFLCRNHRILVMNSFFARGRFLLLRGNSIVKNIPTNGGSSELKQKTMTDSNIPKQLSVYEIGDFSQENYESVFNDENTFKEPQKTKPFDMPLL